MSGSQQEGAPFTTPVAIGDGFDTATWSGRDRVPGCLDRLEREDRRCRRHPGGADGVEGVIKGWTRRPSGGRPRADSQLASRSSPRSHLRVAVPRPRSLRPVDHIGMSMMMTRWCGHRCRSPAERGVFTISRSASRRLVIGMDLTKSARSPRAFSGQVPHPRSGHLAARGRAHCQRMKRGLVSRMTSSDWSQGTYTRRIDMPRLVAEMS